jgi:hypothetical protein
MNSHRHLIPAALCLLGLAAAGWSQGLDSDDDDYYSESYVDTTIITEDGHVLRYKGPLPAQDRPGGIEHVKAFRDDRVPLGYGFKTLRFWKEGDPRPAPDIVPGHSRTEFFDVHYHPDLPDHVGLTMSEYTDYAHFMIKDRLGWVSEERVKMTSPFDYEAYGRDYGLSWWNPGDLLDDGILIQPIAMITSRGFAMETVIHLYVELLMRRKTGDRIPYWFLYGAGAVFGNEEWVLKGQIEVLVEEYEIAIDQATMIRDIEIFRDSELMKKEIEKPGILEVERCRSRLAYWRAFRLAENIITQDGLARFKSLVDSMAADPRLGFEDAIRKTYGVSLAELIAKHEPW